MMTYLFYIRISLLFYFLRLLNLNKGGHTGGRGSGGEAKKIIRQIIIKKYIIINLLSRVRNCSK